MNLICSACGKEMPRKKEASNRLTKGWKRNTGRTLFCESCWHQRYILRAIAMPIASIVSGGDWKEFYAAVRKMWNCTTAASNWSMTQLYTRDVRREGQEKIPPMPRSYLYPEARTLFPDLPAQSVASLEQVTKAKYRARRYDIIWTHTQSLPSHKYPTPFPVHNQSWTANFQDQRPIVSVPIGDKRWLLRLRGGPKFKRQLASFEQLVSGEATPGELSLYRIRRTTDDAQQERYGNQRAGFQAMCKMVAWLPRKAPTESAGVLPVRSTSESLLVAVNSKDKVLWTYNADHLRRWVVEHRKLVLRLSEDQKFEQRPVPTFETLRRKACDKYANRMRSACQQIAASLGGYVEARRFATVRYDDSEHSFCPDFPWQKLRVAVARRLRLSGIEYDYRGASAEVVDEYLEPLAEEKEQ